MYWYYVNKWKRYQEPASEWKETMNVFHGEFHELILFAVSQPEEWIIIFAKEITYSEFKALDGEIG